MKIKRITALLVAAALIAALASPAGAAHVPSQVAVFGDANGDGEIFADDARYVIRCAVGLIKDPPRSGDVAFNRADTDGDSRLTSADARQILRFSVGLDLDADTYDYLLYTAMMNSIKTRQTVVQRRYDPSLGTYMTVDGHAYSSEGYGDLVDEDGRSVADDKGMTLRGYYQGKFNVTYFTQKTSSTQIKKADAGNYWNKYVNYPGALIGAAGGPKNGDEFNEYVKQMLVEDDTPAGSAEFSGLSTFTNFNVPIEKNVSTGDYPFPLYDGSYGGSYSRLLRSDVTSTSLKSAAPDAFDDIALAADPFTGKSKSVKTETAGGQYSYFDMSAYVDAQSSFDEADELVVAVADTDLTGDQYLAGADSSANRFCDLLKYSFSPESFDFDEMSSDNVVISSSAKLNGIKVTSLKCRMFINRRTLEPIAVKFYSSVSVDMSMEIRIAAFKASYDFVKTGGQTQVFLFVGTPVMGCYSKVFSDEPSVFPTLLYPTVYPTARVA